MNKILKKKLQINLNNLCYNVSFFKFATFAINKPYPTADVIIAK